MLGCLENRREQHETQARNPGDDGPDALRLPCAVGGPVPIIGSADHDSGQPGKLILRTPNLLFDNEVNPVLCQHIRQFRMIRQ